MKRGCNGSSNERIEPSPEATPHALQARVAVRVYLLGRLATSCMALSCQFEETRLGPAPIMLRRNRSSFRFDIGGADDLAPFLGLGRQELGKVIRRTGANQGA